MRGPSHTAVSRPLSRSAARSHPTPAKPHVTPVTEPPAGVPAHGGAPETRETGRQFWVRAGMEISQGRLTLAGHDAERLAREHGTPLYAFDLTRIAEQVRGLQGALARAGLHHRVRLAMKAQREPEVLGLRAAPRAVPARPRASDSMSARPARRFTASLTAGFQKRSATPARTCRSAILKSILAHPIHVNVDLLSQLERVGRRAPGASDRDPRQPPGGRRLGRRRHTLYSGDQPTKFGIYEEQLDEALASLTATVSRSTPPTSTWATASSTTAFRP